MDQSENAAAIFNKRASEYQEKFMNTDLYADTFDTFCSNIARQQADVLEVACGPGNITKYLLEKRPDLKIFGTDLAPNMIALARINNPTAHFEIMDCRDVGKLGKRFDALMCGFCLPYLSKLEAIVLIADASNILRPDGVLYISTMEDDHCKSGFEKSTDGKDEIYMNYHQEDYLVTALLANDFKIIDLQRKEYPGRNGAKTTDLIIIALK